LILQLLKQQYLKQCLHENVAVTAQATAQTELTQANIAIDNAQTAVNNLQATIGTTTNVLAGVDDAGIRMNLPFNLLMGNTLYTNVYVGSNATITFGVDQGWIYYQTPNAPSVSIAGWDWNNLEYRNWNYIFNYRNKSRYCLGCKTISATRCLYTNGSN